MEANENRDDKRDQKLEELLTTALKSEPVSSLPYGFAAMVTRNVFTQKVKPFGIKTYVLVFMVILGIVAFSLALLSLFNPQLAESLLSMIKLGRYILGFIVLSFFLIEYIDQKWVRTTQM
ncbi:hypothetical protein [Pedobacter sp. V48]|uniref:hypothetical protein n=1 Tax=Pedobacter sp. V48 TaxID=509635 RepID=UPI0004AE9685|nr:hypothetical protein [Pedobacter sp. V48]